MTTATRTWVTVKEAAEQAGVSESRLRTAYRAGRVAVIEDLVDGRVRKLVQLAEVMVWAGHAPVVEAVEEPAPAPASASLHEERFEELSEHVKHALKRATRAEDQLALVRNELAQLREVYLRVSESLARREAAEFERSVTSMCTSPASRGPRRRVLDVVRRRVSA